MNQDQAAQRLGMKTTEIIGIESVDRGHVVTTHDHQRVLVTADSVEPYSESVPAITADPEPTPPAAPSAPAADGDQVPDGTADTVLQWAGQDAERITRALEAERARPTPRRGLVAQLEKLATPE